MKTLILMNGFPWVDFGNGSASASAHAPVSYKALKISWLVIILVMGMRDLLPAAMAAEPTPSEADGNAGMGTEASKLELKGRSIWNGEVGDGFQAGMHTFDVSIAAGAGVAAFGSEQRHDLAWTSIGYGRFLGGVRGANRWYRGNWELRGELFGGGQFSPTREWLVGLTPHLRYHFATGTRFVPFIDGGAGVMGTSIGLPDLGNKFEFNTQAGGGVQWFLKDDLALTVQTRYVHISCAGISQPNHGVNTVMGIFGVTWYF